MQNHNYFPESSVVQIRGDAEFGARDWYMAMDAHKFHVYVVVALDPNIWIRIDWDDNSTLTFKPLEPRAYAYEPRVHIGTRRFSRAAIEKRMTGYLHQYQLVRFNCRTVSFAVLCVAGFDPDLVFTHFERHEVLCGLVSEECVTWDTLMAYLRWQIAKDREKAVNGHVTTGSGCALF